MCGIVGIWNEANEDIVRRMARSVAHRGPDRTDLRVAANHCLGASRLTIYGDPDAAGFFHDHASGLSVMLNGEIYNAPELRAELQARGIQLQTGLEAELIARLYSLRGSRFACDLKGMFAIALLDDDRLVLARDRFGIKPMYYSKVGPAVAFGSEIKAVLEHPEVQGVLDASALEEAAVFGYFYSAGKTLLQDVRQVEPGSVMTFSKNGCETVAFGEKPKAAYLEAGSSLEYDDAVTIVRKLLIETMDRLTRHGAHSEMGIYLSGGIDSTILALVTRYILGRQVRTFTLADSDQNEDYLAAERVSKALGTVHTVRFVTVADCLKALPHFARHFESLIAGGVFDIYGGLAFHLLSETVSQHVRIAYSGEGADELFGGYYWVYTHPLGFADRLRQRLGACGNKNGLGVAVDALFPLPEDERIYRRNVFDALLRGGLANYHLQSVDRSAGAYGFEIRPAYLYDDLADFAMRLPIDYKVPDKKITKRILRDAFRPELEQLGLDWVLDRPKEGMPAALQNLAPCIGQAMEAAVDDSCFHNHPLKAYLRTKMDVHLFELFAGDFLGDDRHAAACSAA